MATEEAIGVLQSRMKSGEVGAVTATGRSRWKDRHEMDVPGSDADVVGSRQAPCSGQALALAVSPGRTEIRTAVRMGRETEKRRLDCDGLRILKYHGSGRPVCLFNSGAGLASPIAPSYPSKGACELLCRHMGVAGVPFSVLRKGHGIFMEADRSIPEPSVVSSTSCCARPGQGAREPDNGPISPSCAYMALQPGLPGMPRGEQAALSPAWYTELYLILSRIRQQSASRSARKGCGSMPRRATLPMKGPPPQTALSQPPRRRTQRSPSMREKAASLSSDP